MTHSTKKDLAYDYIKRRILEKRLLPGQRITASRIADDIGTSVLPVREALFRLEAEHLVTMKPYVGAVVAFVTTDEVIEVIKLLAVLEGYATSQAAARASEIEDALTSINARLRTALHKEMWSWFIELNREFHFTIFGVSGSDALQDSIRAYWTQLDALLAASSFHLVPNRAEQDLADHDELVRRLTSPDQDELGIEIEARRHRLRTATYLTELNRPYLAP
jgi:DNA-binding GntR family transcriptional regulator